MIPSEAKRKKNLEKYRHLVNPRAETGAQSSLQPSPAPAALAGVVEAVQERPAPGREKVSGPQRSRVSQCWAMQALPRRELRFRIAQ